MTPCLVTCPSCGFRECASTAPICEKCRAPLGNRKTTKQAVIEIEDLGSTDLSDPIPKSVPKAKSIVKKFKPSHVLNASKTLVVVALGRYGLEPLWEDWMDWGNRTVTPKNLAEYAKGVYDGWLVMDGHFVTSRAIGDLALNQAPKQLASFKPLTDYFSSWQKQNPKAINAHHFADLVAKGGFNNPADAVDAKVNSDPCLLSSP